MYTSILNSIEESSKVIGKTWPLYSFVASNPLSGYENLSFKDAVSSAKKNMGSNAFPEVSLFKQAYTNNKIDQTILKQHLKTNALTKSPEYYLDLLDKASNSAKILNKTYRLDQLMSKWLAAFLDEGIAEWDMPFKSEGFFTAWRLIAIYDEEIGQTNIKDIPKTGLETLETVLQPYNTEEYVSIFTYHLAALPGWIGYINHRTNSNSDWQKEFPIDLIDYLAVRLWTAKKINIEISPSKEDLSKSNEILNIQYAFLSSWEKTYQNQLVDTINKQLQTSQNLNNTTEADAQFVFCIDTRSELIRRHIELQGNYETFGYAGFFGIAMDYESLTDGITRKSCPPIVSSAYRVNEKAKTNQTEAFKKHKEHLEKRKFSNYFLKRMKNLLPSAFGYVEGSGLFYAFSLVNKTLFSKQTYRFSSKNNTITEQLCEPQISSNNAHELNSYNIPLEERAAIVKSAFTLMGWTTFAPLVIFAGHGSHSTNNPFSSSLDCGACAASPGRNNARMLAKLANQEDVRSFLSKEYNIIIPKETHFIGAEHNTTTDHIVLFDADVPNSHKLQLKHLKKDIFNAQQTATHERLGKGYNSIKTSHKKANSWSETRPEWGLAKNAGFVIGPRSLTKNTNLESRCFLHSYNWKLDKNGKALEGIMQGPMVVTQWINNHYYFSTIDNIIFGGGSKISHNITGKFGVVQGNGGDLKMGLPLQSLFTTDQIMQHEPLRLSVVIQSPISVVSQILLNNNHLKTLLDNEWIYLLVTDPEQKNEMFKYHKNLEWISQSKNHKTEIKKDIKEALYS